jgi:hypothetical protein
MIASTFFIAYPRCAQAPARTRASPQPTPPSFYHLSDFGAMANRLAPILEGELVI